MDQSTVGGQQVPPIAQRTVGPYQLVAQLAGTPTGPCYLARLAQKETLYALKLLPPLPPEEMARLRQDAGLLSRAEHPGLIKPVDLGMDHGRVYVVGEHVPGQTLREQLDRKGPLQARQAALLVADVADALQVAHDAGVVHRHVDASTVVVDGRDGKPKVAEFGLSRDPRRPAPPGQPPYLPAGWAPEQVKGGRAEAAADVHALGALLYELLTGAPPYEGHTWADLSQAILDGDPEPPGDLVPVPRAIGRACLEALAPDPDDRPTAAELAQELRRAAEPSAGGGRGALVALLLVAPAAAALGAWGAFERSRRTALEAHSATVEGRLEASRLEGAKTRTSLAAAEQRAADLGRQKEALERGQQALQKEVDQARQTATQQAQAAAQLQAQLQQLQQRLQGGPQAAADTLAGGGEGLGPALDALIADLEKVEGRAVLRVRLLVARQRYQDAVAAIAAVRAKGGALPPELQWLEADAEELLGKDERARQLRRELAEKLPEESAWGLFARIATREQLNLPPDLEPLKRAAELAPKEPEILTFYGRLCSLCAVQLRDQALLTRAQQALDQAVAANPWDFRCRLERARHQMTLFNLSGGRSREPLQRALADLRTAREVVGHASLWLEAGKACLSLGALDLATGELLEGMRRADGQRLVEEQARARVLLGLTALLQGDEQTCGRRWLEAVRQFQQAQSTWEFVSYLPRMSPQGQQAVLQALPPQLRQQVEGAVRQMQQGGRPGGGAPGGGRPR